MSIVFDEIIQAIRKKRQPICPYCDSPLEIKETQAIDLCWRWNERQKRYVKTENGGPSDKPECSACGSKDWDFTNNMLVKY